MNKKFKYGFSLAEIMTVMVVIGVITVIALATTVRQDKLREKQIATMTKSFYGNVDSSYSQILNYNATNGEITAIEDKNADNKRDSKDLRILFNTYMEGDDIDCSKLGAGGKISDYINSSVVCSEHPGKVVAGYYLTTACNYTATAKDFYVKGETGSRSAPNACGYIVYGLKGSKGSLGVDLFVIPLGSYGLL